MEDPENKQGKRKAPIAVKGRGGGIGGLVVWGGVLVVGSLIAAFAVKERRKARTCEKKSCIHEGGSNQGLGSILQTASASKSDQISDKNHGSTEVVESQADSFIKDLILDQNPTPAINGVSQDRFDEHHRIDDLGKESIPLSVNCVDAYEVSFPVLDASLSSQVGNGIKQALKNDYMENPEIIKEEKIVEDVKIIERAMSIVHPVDAPHKLMARNETEKLEELVDAEKVTAVETLPSFSAVEMEEVVDAETATSSTNSDDSEEEKMEENEAATIEFVEDKEMVETSYAISKNSSPLESVGEDDDSRDGLPSKEENEVGKGRDLANDEIVIAEKGSFMNSVGVAVDQEENDVKADPVEDLQLMETNDASKSELLPACSAVEDDENDGYVNHEEEKEHGNYTSDGGEDSSEGTETSSAESNSAKIWSVESLDADLKDSEEKMEEEEGQSIVNSVSMDNRRSNSKKVGEDELQKQWKLEREALTKWRRRGFTIPALLLLLLLLLFALHKALFSDLVFQSVLVQTGSEN